MTKIEIDLQDLGFHYDLDGDPIGRKTLEDAVVEAAAARLAQTMRTDITKVINKAVTEQVQDLVRSRVEEVMAQPIRRTTAWGESEGPEVSIRELIWETLERFLTAAPRRDSSFDRNPKGNLADLIEAEVKSVMTKEMQEAVRNAKAEVHKKIEGEALAAAVAVLNR